jgi:hypothetical protein
MESLRSALIPKRITRKPKSSLSVAGHRSIWFSQRLFEPLFQTSGGACSTRPQRCLKPLD